MKKTYLIIAGVVLFVSLCVLVAYFNLFWKKNDALNELAQKIEGYGADVVVIGEIESVKSVDIPFRRIVNIDEMSLSGVNEKCFHLIVLSDLDGGLNVSNEQLKLIRDLCMNKYYCMLYLGEKHMSQLVECGFDTMVIPDEHAIFFNGYQLRNGNPYKFNGESWIRDDEPDTFYANPFIVLCTKTAEDMKVFKREPEKLWEFILDIALETLER